MPETSGIVEDEKSYELKRIESEQAQKDYSLAALNDHPGWIQIRKEMEQDIENFKTLKNINLARYRNDQLGELVRVEHMVAEKLQKYLDKTDNAVKAIKGNKK